MKLKNLFESPETDRKQRKIAENAFEKVRQFFNTNNWKQKVEVVNNGRAIVLPARTIGLDYDLSFAFIDKNQVNFKAIGGVSQNGKYLMLYVPDLDEVDIAMKSRNYRVAFIHEFTHWLDFERVGAPTSSSDKSTQDYYNDPLEFNAYFQESIHDFEHHLKKFLSSNINSRNWALSNLKTFPKFLKLFQNFVEKRFIDNLTSSTDKRIKKRLYKYWYDLNQQLNDHYENK